MSSSPEPDPASPPDFAEVAPGTMVQIGFVFRPHGMEGELKVNPEHTDDPARFEELETVYIGRSPHQVTRHAIASVRYQQTKRGTTVILGLEDIETRSDAEAVAKLHVFAHEDDLELADDEVFIHDLVGLEVVTEAGEALGTVANYMEMPAQDVFVVRRSDGGEAMIPAVEDFIVHIDIDGGRLVVRLVDGLLD
jgi:16S rRNA processing protein RimM